jgi:hypothetical protein
MRVIAYRILGNDLPPRHDPDQTVENLKFCLEHEPANSWYERRFCLNRILDTEKIAVLEEMLQKAKLDYFIVPVRADEYRELQSEEDKIRYLTNVNNARNQCLTYGLSTADWTFPIDGGTFLRKEEWGKVYQALKTSQCGYIGVHTWRADNYVHALSEATPDIMEVYKSQWGDRREMREVTLGFSRRADMRFDERRRYGQVDKAELLWRLGIKGMWDLWEPHIKRESMKHTSVYFKQVQIVGAVCRLPAGSRATEGDNHVRGAARRYGLARLLKSADRILG